MMTFSLVLLIATRRGKKHGDDLQCFLLFLQRPWDFLLIRKINMS